MFKMDFILKKLILFFLIFPSVLFAAKFSLFVTGGPNFSQLSNTSLVNISPQVTNSYLSQTKGQWNGFFGGGLSYELLTALPQIQFSLGLAGYALSLGKVKGVEHPFVNAGLFDTLTYQFDVKSSLLIVEPRFTYTGSNWQPFLLAGVGEAWNHLKNYQETPTYPSLSATPLAFEFRDKTHQSFAYELGFGIQHRLFENKSSKIRCDASLGYRYFNLGRGQFGGLSGQISLSSLGIKNINTQSLFVQLNTSFN